MSKITTGELYQEWQDINSKLLTQIEKQDEIITNQQGIIDRLNGPIDTQLIGSNMEYYVKTENDMPSANEVELGAFCMVIDSGEIYQSDGTDWVVFT